MVSNLWIQIQFLSSNIDNGTCIWVPRILVKSRTRFVWPKIFTKTQSALCMERNHGSSSWDHLHGTLFKVCTVHPWSKEGADISSDGYIYIISCRAACFPVRVCRTNNLKIAADIVLKCPAKLLFFWNQNSALIWSAFTVHTLLSSNSSSVAT